MRPKALLSFVGKRDPCNKDGSAGPILWLLQNRRDITAVILLHTSTESERDSAKKTQSILLGQGLTPFVLDTGLTDPTDYTAILDSLRRLYPEIVQRFPDHEFYVAVSSGSPQMQSCWLLMTATGELPATLLQVRAPEFASEGNVLVEIIPDAPDFSPLGRRISLIKAPQVTDVDLTKAMSASGIAGSHPALLDQMRWAMRAAKTDYPLFIGGESGTGKESVARFIHQNSDRSASRFLAINCGALDRELAESRLFGHEKGAFTGADSSYKGFFREADGGTLFLDEVAELPLPVQVKLLRTLEVKEVRPIGGRNDIPVNVRILAASNRDVATMIRSGEFREDLYHRLVVMDLHLPALNDRRTDIPELCRHLLARVIAQELGRDFRIAPEAVTELMRWDWRGGNVRLLLNRLRRAALFADKGMIHAVHLGTGHRQLHRSCLSRQPARGFRVSMGISRSCVRTIIAKPSTRLAATRPRRQNCLASPRRPSANS